MKIIIKRISIILLCLLLVFSSTCNVILLISNKLYKNYVKGDYQSLEIEDGVIVIDDSYTDRSQIYETAFNSISTSSYLTIKNTNMYGANNYVKETITCYMNQEETNYICKMSSELYDLNDALVKKSYFPGDGYKYTSENNINSKTVYTNENLENYLLNLLTGAVYYLSFISYDTSTVANLNFSNYINFNSLTDLTKDITVTYHTTSYTLSFDKYDVLTKLDLGSNISLDISYELVNFDFPSFEGYVEQ